MQKTYAADIATGDNTGATDKSSTDVRDDSTVEVRHNHDIELAGTSDKLHGARGGG